MAPGHNIQAARSGTKDGLLPLAGTSMAAPHVTGAIALVLAHRHRLGLEQVNAAQVRAALTQSTKQQLFTSKAIIFVRFWASANPPGTVTTAAIPVNMHYLKPIVGSPAVRIMPSGGSCAAVLTEKGFAVCEPAALETGCEIPDCGDDSERCELRRGHAHIRVKIPPKLPLRSSVPEPCWGLNLSSGWIVILPFQDLPEESQEVISRSLPEGFSVPCPSVKPLQSVREAHKADIRRQLRLKDALADAGYSSPVTLQPTGLHSAPLRVYARNQLRPLPLPEGHKLSTLLTNWSGDEEHVEFENWPVRAAE